MLKMTGICNEFDMHKTSVKEQLLGSFNLSLVLVGTQTGLEYYYTQFKFVTYSKHVPVTLRSKLCRQASGEYLLCL